MDVLLHLARHPHTVISAETLLDACWGDTPASDNAVHKIITQLRRALDDSAADPRYIETIRKRGYRLVAELSYDDEVSQGSWTHASPFRGLEAFEERHAAIFFGRKLSVDRLVKVVIEQVQAACALVLVLGPSGAGKTSLVQAGLIPALKAGAAPADAGLAISDHVQIDCADMGQSGLLETLASTLLDAEIDGCLLFANTSAAALADYMARDLPGLIAHLQAQLPTIRLAVFIDRFEAIFRLPHITEAERAGFIHVLEQLARSGSLLLVLACRNDFYPQLGAYPALMNVKLRGGHFDLAPPGSADIAQIVRHPAQAAQLRYTVDAGGESLDELLCHAAKAGPDTLPLLQYCLQELYRQRTPDGELTHAAFHAMGGLEGAIGARAEQVISALGPGEIAALPQLLARLVLVAEDETTVTSRRVPWSALASGDETRLVQALVDAHLFVSDLHGGAPAFGIAHEALLRRWPRVVAWVEQHRQALQTRSRISVQARRWQDSGRQRDMLLPSGTQANQARDLLGSSALSFTAAERAFIDQSLARARRAERLRLTIMAVVTGLALLAAVLGFKARTAQLEAEAHRTEAEGLMGFMLGEFVEKLRPLGKLELLDSVSSRAMSYLATQDHAGMRTADLAQRARSLQVIAEVRNARGDAAGALAALEAGRTTLRSLLAASPEDLPLLKSAGENAFWLGQTYFDQRNWPQARHYFDEYRQHAAQMGKVAPTAIDSLVELSYAHNSLGSVALRRGEVADAAREFALSVQLKSQAYAREPDNASLASTLADSLSWQATAIMQLGNFADADALYLRQAQLLEALRKTHPGDAGMAKKLADVWSRHSELKQAQGELPASLSLARQAYALHAAAVERDPTNRRWQQFLHSAALRLIEAQTNLAPDGADLDNLNKLQDLKVKLAELIAQEPKKAALKLSLAETQLKIAAASLEGHRQAAAQAAQADAARILAPLYTASPDDRFVINMYVDAQLMLARLDGGSGPAADAACAEARRVLAPLVQQTADFRILSRWVMASACGSSSSSSSSSDGAMAVRSRLEKMPYHDPQYLRYLSHHQPKKALSWPLHSPSRHSSTYSSG